MTTTYKKILLAAAAGMLTIGCAKVLDQVPQDALSEATFFKTPAQIKAAADNLHTNVYAWGGNTTYAINFDWGSDLVVVGSNEGSGINTAGNDDTYWNQAYTWLRTVNVFLSKTDEYAGNKAEIAGYTGQGYFFRAWHHFFLLKRFGGVPIAAEVTLPTSEVVNGPRASRYQVMDQIIKDLDSSIANLTRANVTKTSSNNDGHVTVEAAKAFKARVCLFEGTWEKYVKTTTDGDGINTGAGSEGYNAGKYTQYLTMARDLSKEVIDGGKFSLWKGVETAPSAARPAMYKNTSYFYLFNIEGTGSNPNNLTKSSNNEAIFRSVYEFGIRNGGTNLTHSKPCAPSRKFMDMALCTDGLPVHLSPLFNGYATMTAEFNNRDYRLTSMIYRPMEWYWGFGKYNTGAAYATDITTLSSTTYQYIPNLTGGGAYISRKYATERNDRTDNQESADYQQIRLAEVYLVYAEAVCELGGGDISDADLNYSINKVRERAGVAPLTHALIAPYPGLSLLGEIRRERAIELQGEGYRISDLCRWGLAEQELAGKPTCSAYLTYNGTATEYSTAKNPNTNKPVLTASAYTGANTLQTAITPSAYAGIPTTKAGAIITEQAANRKFALKNYLQPIGVSQLQLNPNLKQNPGW